MLLTVSSVFPDLTLDLKSGDNDGRLFIPSESKLAILRSIHRFRYLWSYTWPQSLKSKVQLVACLIIMVLTRVCNVLIPYYSKKIIDKLTVQPLPQFNSIYFDVAVLVVLQMLFSTNGLLQTVHRCFLYVGVQQESVRQVQVMTFKHLLHLPYQWHVKRKTGEILRSTDRGAESVTNLVNWIFFQIGPTLVDVIIATVYFGIAFNWQFGVLVLICMGAYTSATVIITQWATKYRQGMNQRDNETSGSAVDSLLNYEQVKLNVNEENECRDYENRIMSYQKAQLKSHHSTAVRNITQSIVMVSGSSVGIFMCLSNIIDGSFTVGDYVLFGTYINQLYVPLEWLGAYYSMVQAAFIDTQNLMNIFAVRPENRDPTEPIKIDNSQPLSFELENVNFKYNFSERTVLESLSIKIPPGQTWAFVGESGSGKSTILRLLMGLIKPTTGIVRVNGFDAKQIGYKQLRSCIGTVSQDCQLFNTTVRANISYGKDSATEDEIKHAADIAELKVRRYVHKFII